MVAAQRAYQAGNKIINSGESSLKENTLGKESLHFQQFSLCCFVITVNFPRQRSELLSPVRQNNTGKVFTSKGKRPASEPKQTQTATQGYTGEPGIPGNVLDEKLIHQRFAFHTLLRHLYHPKILVLN